jgi:hypothetical protein
MAEESNQNKNNNDDLSHLEFDSPSPLEQDATSMHEMFMALMKSGFTEDQALKLVALLVEQPDVETVHFHFDNEMSDEILDDLNDEE